jgi:hypothetical protein
MRRKSIKVRYINIEILKKLIKLKPVAYERMLKKYPWSQKWLSGQDYSTYNQLIELSKIFNVSFGDFFLEELPKRKMSRIHIERECGPMDVERIYGNR